jgi:hypothetical protein
MIARGGKICCPEPEPMEDVIVHGHKWVNAVKLSTYTAKMSMCTLTERAAISDAASIRCLCPQDYYDRLLRVQPTNTVQFRMTSRRRVTDRQTDRPLAVKWLRH